MIYDSAVTAINVFALYVFYSPTRILARRIKISVEIGTERKKERAASRADRHRRSLIVAHPREFDLVESKDGREGGGVGLRSRFYFSKTIHAGRIIMMHYDHLLLSRRQSRKWKMLELSAEIARRSSALALVPRATRSRQQFPALLGETATHPHTERRRCGVIVASTALRDISFYGER